MVLLGVLPCWKESVQQNFQTTNTWTDFWDTENKNAMLVSVSIDQSKKHIEHNQDSWRPEGGRAFSEFEQQRQSILRKLFCGEYHWFSERRFWLSAVEVALRQTNKGELSDRHGSKSWLGKLTVEGIKLERIGKIRVYKTFPLSWIWRGLVCVLFGCPWTFHVDMGKGSEEIYSWKFVWLGCRCSETLSRAFWNRSEQSCLDSSKFF